MRKNPLPVKTIAICRDVSGGTQTLRNKNSRREFYGGSGKLANRVGTWPTISGPPYQTPADTI